MMSSIKHINNIFIENTYNKSITCEDIIKNKVLLSNKKLSSPLSAIYNELASYKKLSYNITSPIIQLVASKNITKLISITPEQCPIIQLKSNKEFTRLVSTSPKATFISSPELSPDLYPELYLESSPESSPDLYPGLYLESSPEQCPIIQLKSNKEFTRHVSTSPKRSLSSFDSFDSSESSPIRQLMPSKGFTILISKDISSPVIGPMPSPFLSPIGKTHSYNLKPYKKYKKNYTLDNNYDIEALVPNNYLIKKNRSMSCDSILNYYIYKPKCIRWLYNKNMIYKNGH